MLCLFKSTFRNTRSVFLYKLITWCLFLVKPSGIRCYVDGSEEIGNDFKLKCEPKEGSLPLRYEWQKLSDSQKLPTSWLPGTADYTAWFCAINLNLSLVGFVHVCIDVLISKAFPFLDREIGILRVFMFYNDNLVSCSINEETFYNCLGYYNWFLWCVFLIISTIDGNFLIIN